MGELNPDFDREMRSDELSAIVKSAVLLSLLRKVVSETYIRLLLVAFEHVLPERLYLLNVASLAVHWNPGEQKTFCEFALQANLLFVRAS